MDPSAVASRTSIGVRQVPAFEWFAGFAGIVTGIASLLYAVFFLLVKGPLNAVMPPLMLAIGGFLATAVAVGVYSRVHDADPLFALWALALGLLGQMGAAIHGVYGLALQLDLPSNTLLKTQPSPLDPAGFLAFGIVGVSVLAFAWLILHGGQLPRNLGYLGVVLGIALVALFLGALFTDNNAKSLFVLVPGGLASLIATPAWNIWLGVHFLRRARA